MLPRFVRTAVLCIALLGVFSEYSSFAQSSRDRGEPVYQSRPADVPLQPFSMQVAYYSPGTFRPAEPRRDSDETTTSSSYERNDSHPMVPGNQAVLRHGIAYAPANAPDRVKNAIWAVNNICNRPYVWGGGHGSFHDYGYDCSGTVSYALHYAGALNQPLASSELGRFGEPGHGRWITVYSRRGHTFAVIAGLRLDTTDFRYGGNVGPRWHVDGRDTWSYDARHPAKL